jgi:hypothetical protein
MKMPVIVAMLVAVAAAGVFAQSSTPTQSNDPVTQAIASNDYNAFVQALQQRDNVSQTQFNQVVQQYKQQQAEQNAIRNNDYNAWKSAMSGVADQSALTKDVFNAEMQEQKASQDAQQAIANNDYNAWKQAMTTLLQTQMQQLTPSAFKMLEKQSGMTGGAQSGGSGMQTGGAQTGGTQSGQAGATA